MIEVELTVEELEEVVAPSPIIPPASPLRNHNETLVGDEVGLTIEELKEVIAPRQSANHNETLVSNEVE